MLKKLGRGLSSTILKLTLYLLATTTAIVIVFGTPAHIKKALVSSKVYDTFVNNALDEAKKNQAEGDNSVDTGEVSLDNQIVRDAANKAITPQLLRTSSEGALDGFYGWMQRKTAQPEFTIDLTTAKQTFATSVGDSLLTRIQGLPVCTTAQLRALNTSDIDLFTLACRPSGVNLEAQRQELVAKLSSSEDFLDKPVITGSDLPKNDRGQTITDQLKAVPKVYFWVKVSPWVLSGVAVVCLLGVIFLSEERRKAFKSLWITFLSVGGVLLISFFIARWLTNKVMSNPDLSLNNTSFQQSGLRIVEQLSRDVNQVVLWFAIGYLLLAAVLFGVWQWLGRSQPKKAVAKESEPSATAQTSA